MFAKLVSAFAFVPTFITTKLVVFIWTEMLFKDVVLHDSFIGAFEVTYSAIICVDTLDMISQF